VVATHGVTVEEDGDLLSKQQGGQVLIPSTAAEQVRIETSAGELGIGLPQSDALGTAQRPSAGTLIYAGKDVDSAVQALDDGGARALVIIKNADAPREYRFPLTLPAGATAEQVDYATENGTETFVAVTGADGTLLAAFDTPWATDARGADVPTFYRLEGTTLVQQVDFGAGSAFPIVADPSVWERAKCAATVIRVAATHAIPLGKVFKVGKLMAKHGPKKIARAIMNVRRGKKASAADLQKAAEAFLDIDDIRNAC
jgi:hypothetical protein